MRVCWMLVILLGCRLSRTTLSQCPCNCNEPPKFHRVPTNGSLFVPCPNTTNEEDMKFDLFRDQEIIFSCNLNQCKNMSNRSTLVEEDRNDQKQLVGLIVSGDADRNLVTYRCMGTVMYPPPLKYKYSEWQVALPKAQNYTCKEDNHHNNSKPREPQTIKRTERFLWMWITAVVLLSTYGLIVTILAVVLWVKLNTTDNQSDYMNTKPRASRERRKKGGIQNPIPRYV